MTSSPVNTKNRNKKLVVLCCNMCSNAYSFDTKVIIFVFFSFPFTWICLLHCHKLFILIFKRVVELYMPNQFAQLFSNKSGCFWSYHIIVYVTSQKKFQQTEAMSYKEMHTNMTNREKVYFKTVIIISFVFYLVLVLLSSPKIFCGKFLQKRECPTIIYMLIIVLQTRFPLKLVPS